MTTRHHLDRDGDLIHLYLDHLRLIRRSRHTIRTYGSCLLHGHRHLPEGLPRASGPELLHWTATAQTTATQTQRLKAIRSFFGWATKNGHLDYDPTGEVPQPRPERRLPKVPRDDDVHRVLTETPADVRLWSTLAAYGGLRRGEISRLRREDVADLIKIDGKGAKDRLVPTHPLIASAVADLPTGRITTLTEEQLGMRAWHQYHRIGVAISLHRLRAWCGSTMLRAGVDLATVQDLLGHEDPATTRRYATPSGQQYRRAIDALTVLGATAAAPAAAPPPSPAPAGRT